MALTAAEQAELALLEKQYGSAQPSGLTPEEEAELAALEAAQAPQPESKSLVGHAWDGIKHGVDYGLRGLDYAAGITRTGVADVLSDADKIGAAEWEAAKRGQALSSAQLMEKAGVPEGYQVDILPEGTPFGLGKGKTSVRDVGGFVGDVALDPLTYLSFGTSALGKQALKAQLAGKLGKAAALEKAAKVVNAIDNPLASLSSSTGKKIYKSGLKAIDEEAIKYGKEPVSDLLMKEKVWGTTRSIGKQMDELGDRKLLERNSILKEATKAGAEVDMSEAMAPAMAKIADLKASGDPKKMILARRLQKEVDKYLALGAKEGESVIRELPRGMEMGGGHTPVDFVDLPGVVSGEPSVMKKTGLDVAGGPITESVPQTLVSTGPTRNTIVGATVPDMPLPQAPLSFMDFTERMAGPTPIKASGMKTSLTGAIPDAMWRDSAIYGSAKEAEKSLGRGMKEAVEKSVGRASGKEKQELLKRTNAELGQILTTKEKQAIEASKAAKKDVISQVDALAASAGFWPFVYKKAAQTAQMPLVRTGVGLGLQSAPWQMMIDPLSRRLSPKLSGFTDEESYPYTRMLNNK